MLKYTPIQSDYKCSSPDSLRIKSGLNDHCNHVSNIAGKYSLWAWERKQQHDYLFQNFGETRSNEPIKARTVSLWWLKSVITPFKKKQ